MKKNKILSKEILENLLSKHKSVGKVAVELSIPYSTIYSWYKKYNITLLPSCMTIYEELRSIDFSETQKSVVLGSILGDGSLLKNRRSKNARLQIGHCTKQLDYLKWKDGLLKPFSSKITQAEIPGPKIIMGKESWSSGYYLMNTIAHPTLTEYFNKYYVKGKKRVHKDIIEDLDILALAIWLADDGSFSLRKECNIALRGSIATCSFYEDELNILVKALSKFYGGHIGIDKYNNTLVMTNTKEIESLLDNVLTILPECIHYKFVPQRLRVKPLIK